MRRDRKSKIRKERMLMRASSLLVMGALTMTGIYMKGQSEENKDDGYTMDFSELENDTTMEPQADQNLAEGLSRIPGEDDTGTQWAEGSVTEDDLDYDPLAAGSNVIQIPGLTDGQEKEADTNKLEWEVSDRQEDEKKSGSGDSLEKDTEKADTEKTDMGKTDAQDSDYEIEWESEPASEPETEASVDTVVQTVEEKELHFQTGQNLVRPVAGDVLLPYSMDSSIHFATLDQYKYNPAMIFTSVEGENVIACAEGKVISVYEDVQIGTAVVLELGDGYQATYGQLKEIQVSQGEYVKAGDVLGCTAKPTKYYSVEGANVYFALTKDGEPVDPEGLFQ